MKINFNLRDKNNPTSSVLVILRFKGMRLKRSLSIKVPVQDWNFRKQRLNVKNKRVNLDINKFLDKKHSFFMEAFSTFLSENGRIPNKNEFVELFETTASKPKILDFFDQHIEYLSSKNNRQGNKLNPRAVGRYTNVKARLQEYFTASRSILSFESITIKFHTEYLDWLLVKGYKMNSCGTDIKVIKSIMRESYAKGYHNNRIFESKDFYTPKEHVDEVWLTKTELETLNNFSDFDNTEQRVVDLFLFACWTGMRYSDFTRTDTFKIDRETIEFKQQKTGGKVTIPLHPIVKQLLIRYPNGLPTFPNPIFNKIIKMACRKARINQLVESKSTMRNKEVKDLVPKWKRISAHTARRTMATNLYLDKIPLEFIMKITGHKKSEQLRTYLKIDNLMAIDAVNNVWNN